MKRLLLGNEAIARGAYEASVTVVSSYPGTPSTEITEYISLYDEIYSEWAPNEKVAAEVAIGASIAGGRSLTAMKHVGLNVAADPLFTASYTGVTGGLVVCVADDQGLHSSQNEQDSRNYAYSAKIPMLEPSDSQECKDFIKTALSISEEYDTPVFVRLSTRVAHSRSLVEVSERADVPIKPYVKNPGKYVMMPAMAKARHIVVEERTSKLTALGENLTSLDEIKPLNLTVFNSRKIGVISAGIAYQYAKEALGDNASYLKLGMVHPLPEKLIADFVNAVDVCYVIEELDPFIENHCKRLGLKVVGKEKFSLLGEYSAALIKKVILNEEAEKTEVSENIPNRPPVMCAGCPHRGVFHVLKQLKLTVSGDIGCYTLGALPPLTSIDAVVCMGASIGMAHGMEKAGLKENTVAVIGDSTFIHSGITGLIDVVYNKGTSTVIILDNSVTGMTGHQDNPTTGKTIKGEPTIQVDLEMLCKSIGVRRVVVADPFDYEAFKKAVNEEIEATEPSVVIARRPCALLKTAGYSGKYKIDADKCRNCGACMQIGCPAVSRKNGTIEIDATQCVGCGYCACICKFSSIVKEVL